MKLRKLNFRLNGRKRPCNSFPEEMTEAQFLGMFKVRLDKAIKNVLELAE